MRKLSALCEYVAARYRAELELSFNDIELTLLGADNVLRRSNLRAQRGFAYGRRDDVRAQREVGAFELEALVVDE